MSKVIKPATHEERIVIERKIAKMEKLVQALRMKAVKIIELCAKYDSHIEREKLRIKR